MDAMERLMAQGIDYFDAELSVDAVKQPERYLKRLSHNIAVTKLTEDEDLQYFDGPMIITNNINIMMEGLEECPIGLN